MVTKVLCERIPQIWDPERHQQSKMDSDGSCEPLKKHAEKSQSINRTVWTDEKIGSNFVNEQFALLRLNYFFIRSLGEIMHQSKLNLN